jgi:hypothetical protein
MRDHASLLRLSCAKKLDPVKPLAVDTTAPRTILHSSSAARGEPVGTTDAAVTGLTNATSFALYTATSAAVVVFAMPGEATPRDYLITVRATTTCQYIHTTTTACLYDVARCRGALIGSGIRLRFACYTCPYPHPLRVQFVVCVFECAGSGLAGHCAGSGFVGFCAGSGVAV